MKFAINVQMVQLAMALACALFLEPVSGRAVVGGQAGRDLSAGEGHGHGHNHEITSAGGFARRDFGQEDHDHIPGVIYKRVPPRRTTPQRTAPKNKQQVPVRSQPKKQPTNQRLTQQTKKKPLSIPKTDPKTKPAKDTPKTGPKPKKTKCNGDTTTPGQTNPRKTTTQKKKTGIRSLWQTLTRRVSQTPGSSTDSTTTGGTGGDSCPVPGPSAIFKADCGVELNTATLGIEENAEETPVNLPEDEDSLTSDMEDLGLEDFFKLEDFPATTFATDLNGRCVSNTDRSRERAVNFKCNDGTGKGNVPGASKQYSYSWPVWPHPTPNDFFTKSECNLKHVGWFVDTAKAAGVASCVNPDMMSKLGNWGLKKKKIITPPTEPVTDYHTEHVYELNFLGNYFKYLNEVKKVTCENLDKYLFRKSRAIAANIKAPRGAENRLVYMLINELGSEMNMQRLAVLDGSVNTLKYNILAKRITNPVNIAKFKASDLNQKMTAFRRVCMVMEYLTMTQAVFKDTKDAIERNLGRFDTAIRGLNLNPSPLPAGVKLKTAHHEFITEMIEQGNTKAQTTLNKMHAEIIADPNFKKLDAAVQKTFNDFKTKGVRTFLTTFAVPVATV